MCVGVCVVRDELLLALLAGRVLVFGAGHGDLGRVALLLQQVLEGVQLVALVQGREIGRLQHVTTCSEPQPPQQHTHTLLTHPTKINYSKTPNRVARPVFRWQLPAQATPEEPALLPHAFTSTSNLKSHCLFFALAFSSV